MHINLASVWSLFVQEFIAELPAVIVLYLVYMTAFWTAYRVGLRRSEMIKINDAEYWEYEDE